MDGNQTYKNKVIRQPLSLQHHAALKLPAHQISKLSPALATYVRAKQKFLSDKNLAIEQAIDQTYLKRLEHVCSDCQETWNLDDLYLERPSVFVSSMQLLKKCVDANNISGARWFLNKFAIPKQEDLPADAHACFKSLLHQAISTHKNEIAILLLDYVKDFDGVNTCIVSNNFVILPILIKRFPIGNLKWPLHNTLVLANTASYSKLLPFIEKEFQENSTGKYAQDYCDAYADFLISNTFTDPLHKSFFQTILKNKIVKDALQPVLNKSLLRVCATLGENHQAWIPRNYKAVTHLKSLLDFGADPLTTDENGKIPLQLLLEKPQKRMVSWPYEFNSIRCRYWDTSHLDEAVGYFLEINGHKQVSHTDVHGNTLAHTASASLVIDQLVAHGANLNQRNNAGEIPSLVFVKANIKDWKDAEDFYHDNMESDLYPYLRNSDNSIPDHQGTTVLGYLYSLSIDAKNPYFAQEIIKLFKQPKKQPLWQKCQLKPIANATIKTTLDKQMISSIPMSNPLSGFTAACTFRDKNGHIMQAPHAQKNMLVQTHENNNRMENVD